MISISALSQVQMCIRIRSVQLPNVRRAHLVLLFFGTTTTRSMEDYGIFNWQFGLQQLVRYQISIVRCSRLPSTTFVRNVHFLTSETVRGRLANPFNQLRRARLNIHPITTRLDRFQQSITLLGQDFMGLLRNLNGSSVQ